MNFSINRGLPIACLFWLGAVAAAFAVGVLNGSSVNDLLPYAGAGVLPALAGLILWPFSNREWAQVLVILSWIAFAITACFAIAFVPMAILFLCAPLAAALFEREKVIEAMVLSAIFAAVVFYAGSFGYAPQPIANETQMNWGQLAGIMATIAFMIGAMYFAANSGAPVYDPLLIEKAGFADAYPGAAFKFTGTGIMTAATNSALSLFEFSNDDIGSATLADFIPEFDEADNQDSILLSAFVKAREQNEPVSVTITSPTKMCPETNEPAYFDLEFLPQEDGNIYGFVSDCSDVIAKLRDVEKEKANANKQTAEKDLFFAGVSHELRTPLNAIIGFSDMMRSRLFGPLPGKYAEYADLIHDSGQHMLDLIGDVLDMSKVDAGKYKLHYDEFDVGDVIRSTMKMVRPSADAAELTLVMDIETDTDLLLQADRRAVRQILLNLLSNAIKFTPKGGEVLVSAKQAQDVMNISVEDNGMGINPSELAKIGEAYTQAKTARMVDARGSGLGLTLVKNLTELHKGRFAMISHPGAGTNANIYLPLKKPEDAP